GTWVLDGRELADTFGVASVRIVNDLEALGWAVLHLGPDDCRTIGGGQCAADAPIAVIAPGTGLGMACVVPGREPRILASEAAHAALAADSDQEAAIVGLLRRRHGHVSIERALSGQGVENLHAAVRELAGAAPHKSAAPEISQAALAGADRHARRALDL